MEERDALSFVNAAAAGRLVVALLFAANAAAYFVEHSAYAAAGMLCAIGAASCGYFACSAAAYLQDSGKPTLAAIALSVLSGLAFVAAA